MGVITEELCCVLQTEDSEGAAVRCRLLHLYRTEHVWKGGNSSLPHCSTRSVATAAHLVLFLTNSVTIALNPCDMIHSRVQEPNSNQSLISY